MEERYSLSKVAWVTQEAVPLRHYFHTFQEQLDAAQGQPHPQQDENPDAALLRFLGREEPDADAAAAAAAALRKDCSMSLLDVEDELQQTNPREKTNSISRITNWYTAAFQDEVVPACGREVLETLRSQHEELARRSANPTYAKCRHRMLKYFSTLRIPSVEDGVVPKVHQVAPGDIVLNVRILQPFHYKSHYSKLCNRLPKYSQELLVLGSQLLTELRDAIACVNDISVNHDHSHDPRNASFPTTAEEFPSGFFYINKVFYDDTRHPDAVQYSENIISWASKYPEIGAMEVRRMEETRVADLSLRLGFPYVYLHLGSCEHLLVVTDVWQHHPTDLQDRRRYPVARAWAYRQNVKCTICHLLTANWIVKNDPRLPIPITPLCDSCLHNFCYDDKGHKIHDIKVTPFVDEAAYVMPGKKPGFKLEQ